MSFVQTLSHVFRTKSPAAIKYLINLPNLFHCLFLGHSYRLWSTSFVCLEIIKVWEILQCHVLKVTSATKLFFSIK